MGRGGGGQRLAVIGHINAITYKEVFPLIRENRLWLGASHFNRGMYFQVPENFQYASTYRFDRERNGVKVNRVPGAYWFTNLEHGRPTPATTTTARSRCPTLTRSPRTTTG